MASQTRPVRSGSPPAQPRARESQTQLREEGAHQDQHQDQAKHKLMSKDRPRISRVDDDTGGTGDCALAEEAQGASLKTTHRVCSFIFLYAVFPPASQQSNRLQHLDSTNESRSKHQNQ